MINLENIVNGFIENIILKSDFENPLWNSENKAFSKKNKWNYIDGCIIKALTELYEINHNEILFKFAKRYTDSFISDENTIYSMDIKAYNLDNINGGKNLLYFYKKTKEEKYINTCDWIYNNQLKSQPRLNCGNFWHKYIYPNQIWLDGVYMALPFMAEYSQIKKISEINDDIKRQLMNIRNIMMNSETGLYYHGYDETKSIYWADKNTGLSSEYWLRAMGWLMAGLADIFEITSDSELKKISGDMLKNLLESIEKYQSYEGMLYQLPAKPDLKNNYPETSGTSLYAYSCLKASRLGICKDDIRCSGIKALNGIAKNYIVMDNIPIMKNICLVAGLGGNQYRDGSESYYLNEIITQNDAKGIAPFIMAYTEYIKSQ